MRNLHNKESSQQRDINSVSKPICNSTAAKCGYKVIQCVHVLDFPAHKLQTSNIEQKQAVNDTTYRIIELERY